jgi:hypothetical protein
LKKHLFTVLTALAVILGLAACGGDAKSAAAPAKPGILVITNNTGEDLKELDISVSSEAEDWENVNLFNGKVLKRGESIEIPTSSFVKDEAYDLAFTGEDNSYFKMEVDVKKVGTVTVEKSDVFTSGDEE